ncbi:MAG: hypothetical protein M3350_01480 [Actinomycetota bacterium]|nr:hypothetical protein [Actinomycetota bacterium]
MEPPVGHPPGGEHQRHALGQRDRRGDRKPELVDLSAGLDDHETSELQDRAGHEQRAEGPSLQQLVAAATCSRRVRRGRCVRRAARAILVRLRQEPECR